jgi:pyroglutamyl-peptidase
MPPPRVLVVGFGPFPSANKNPSGALALAVANSRRLATAAKIVGMVIPTVYENVLLDLSRLLRDEKPDIVLMFGLAGSTPLLRIETRAANVASSIHPDAAGKRHAQHSLAADAPQILKIRAPARRLLAAARKAGARARLSVDAGDYICNAAFFHSLEVARKTGAPKLVAFVHIPWPRSRCRRKAPARKTGQPAIGTLRRAGEEMLLTLIAAARG